MKKLIHGIFLILNFIVIFCAIMTYLGSSISPEKFLLPAYFALIYPFIIFLNLAFVIFWLILKKWYLLFSLLLIIFSIPQIKTIMPLHAQNDKQEEDGFTIMSYNTAMLGGYQKHTANNPNKVVQHILDTDPDIVCIQEFSVSNDKFITHEDIFKIFKKYPYKHIYYKSKKSYRQAGNATFSKYPMINRQTIEYTSKFNSAILSDIVIGKDTIRVINCHLESNKLTEKDKAMPMELRKKFDAENLSSVTLHLSRKLGTAYRTRAEQADTVHELIEKSPYKIIVCGDFNDVPLSYAYTKVKGELQDTFVELGFGLGNTFNERFYKFRIDYILCDKNMTPLEFTIDKVPYSDHYPIHCRLTTEPKQ